MMKLSTLNLLALSFSLLFTACGEGKENKKLIVKSSPLENTLWKLEGYGYTSSEEKSVLISSPYTLDFKQVSYGLNIKTDCEVQRVHYTSIKDKLTLTTKLKDKKNCPLSPSTIYQKQHSFILDALNHTDSYTLENNSLLLHGKDDERLHFVKVTSSALKESELQELKAFQSDGCSAFPDGTLFEQELWLKCCQAHDYAYWKGGTFEEKEASDKELETCVSKVGEPAIAALMLLGVTVGGSPLFDTEFRWGYGWPYYKAYGKLSKIELQQIAELSN